MGVTGSCWRVLVRVLVGIESEKEVFLGYLRVRSSQTHLINQWLERVCICKQTVNRRHVRLRKHPFLLARDICEWNFCPLMRTFVRFINKRQSCFTHV